MTFEGVETVASPTGAALAMRFSASRGRARAIVQISHGVSEHSLRYMRFAEFLNEQSFHVYAHDHRGHGLTRANGAPLGRFAPADGPNYVLDDLDAINNLARARHPDLPVILFGHSMGGLIALNYVVTHPDKVDAVAIWNANFSAGLAGRIAQGILRAERMLLGSDVPSMILPKLTFQQWGRSIANARTASDWLSRDPDEVDAYLTDPLSGWNPTVSMWRDILEFMFDGADNARLSKVPHSLPFNLVGGSEDPATAKGQAVRDLESRMEKLGFTNVTTKIYEDTRHEGLNEMNRESIMQDFADWASRSVSKRPTKLASA
ncbi:alpha/beta hydrolase [Phyllobacterium endophyticum]|uniref:Alpha/beta hydrolase n=1 Tax=Phyllobacterium endophyticum TaxID=1149773 RepID=A0A2P7ANL5_9HYPH|nr:alpha/beta hydrolase [Phyllobacterium endophyticum]MBB3233885.1 alpha-beta hydrolase superfamily lysophospholipase [Phyllobacterium endophyticum]PSH55799.1 alpha/beta hydrolase [Phyllobacterium endophyticum]TYR43679.1 alpha/beta hydrolase [Phyllobacterium endophyticum]